MTASHSEHLKLPRGALQLTSLSEGRLLLAELVEGAASTKEIFTAMGQAGISYGIIREGIDLLAKEYSGPVPVARAEVVDIPAQIEGRTFVCTPIEQVAEDGRFERLQQMDTSIPVKAGQKLLEFVSPSKTVIRFPDGKYQKAHDHELPDPNLFTGPNTTVDGSKQTVIAEIDGLAHQSAFGSVAVFPSERAFGVSSGHGKLIKETALMVENDIADGSYIETVSTLIVRGAIHGAFIQADGNIQISFAADNRTRNRDAKLIAGQAVRIQALENTPVWAGSNVIVAQSITRCNIECLDTVITPAISASKISVGNRLITKDVKGYSVISLGSRYVSDPRVRTREATLTQHIRRHNDLDNSLVQHRFTYNRARDNLSRQIDRMRDSSYIAARAHSARQVLQRLFDTLDDSLEAYRTAFQEYMAMSEMLARERVALDYYHQRMSSFHTPYIRIYGTMDAGTQIRGPEGKIVLKEPFSNGRIVVDRFTNELRMESL